MNTPSQILEAAMALNPEARAEVAQKILLSLESADFDEDASQEWAAEIRRRLQAIREGRVVLSDWDDALARMRQAIGSRRTA
jgi:putative addiction module component (TIGR02574 family)